MMRVCSRQVNPNLTWKKKWEEHIIIELGCCYEKTEFSYHTSLLEGIVYCDKLKAYVLST